ncbi:MAG: hypothetical protein ACON4X_09505 [Polaribacter sp.]
MKNAFKELGIGFIIGVITFWFVEYNVRILLGVPLKYYLIVGSAASVFGFTYFLNKEILKASFFITHGVLVAQLTRILYDLSKDSHTHNLLPFELFDTLIVCFLSGLVGGGLTLFLKRPKPNQEHN